MKRLLSWMSALLLIGGCADRFSDSPSGETRIRVMSYNIHHAEGEDAKVSPERIADVIVSQKPDLVALQEVDVATTRVAGIDLAAQLGELTHMHVQFGKAIDFQGGAYGQAILSRYPISSAVVHRLPGKAGAEQRIAVSADVTLPSGLVLRFVSTHLDHIHDETDRLAQAAEINRVLATDMTPTILAGDFNATPDSQTVRIIETKFEDAAPALGFTYPADQPTRKIDWVFFRPRGSFRLIGASVLPVTSASDHRPVVCDLALRVPTAHLPRSSR